MLGGFTFCACNRFKEFKFNNIPLIYDTETNYVKVNDVVVPPKNVDPLYSRSSLNYTNNIINDWIKTNRSYIKTVSNNNLNCDLINNIKTNDSEIWDSFSNNRTLMYYYLDNIQSYNGDEEMFKGYYFNIQLLPKIIYDLRT